MKYCTIKLSKFLLVNWESLQHYVIHWTSSWAVVVLNVHAYHGIFSTTIPPKCSWGWRNSSPWSTSLFCSNHGQKNDIYIYISQVKSMLRWSLKENLWSPSTEPWNKSPGCKEKSKRTLWDMCFLVMKRVQLTSKTAKVHWLSVDELQASLLDKTRCSVKSECLCASSWLWLVLPSSPAKSMKS